MAREPRSLAALAESVRWAYLAVNAAMPLPFEPGGIVEASPVEDHLMSLREIAFGMALDDLMTSDYQASAADLRALERGQLPARAAGQED